MKTIKEYAQAKAGSSMLMEALEDKLDEKKFSKLAPMPKNANELRSSCASHAGFKTLQKKASAAGFDVSSGFIRYMKMVDKDGKTVSIGLDNIVLNYDAQNSKGLTNWEISFQSDHYGSRTNPDKSNKLKLSAHLHMNMDNKELVAAKKEIETLVDFVVWFNNQKIEKLLPVFGETRVM